jgi:hypothetical protein
MNLSCLLIALSSALYIRVNTSRRGIVAVDLHLQDGTILNTPVPGDVEVDPASITQVDLLHHSGETLVSFDRSQLNFAEDDYLEISYRGA